MTPEEIAQKSADLLWADDIAAQEHGMRIDCRRPGRGVAVDDADPVDDQRP